MRGDTVLDYAEFVLTQSRSRCQLFVSAEGVTEKLASGVFKPFLTHLHAAEQLVDSGCQSIRLECKPNSRAGRNARAWFTKGTIERFVRFVSTPEVLEQVKTIEDELVQLQFVQKIRTGDRPVNIDGLVTKNGSKARTIKHQERNEAQTMSWTHSFVAGNEEAGASTRELLRAMNVRLVTLQQEQNIAFSHAAAAGFDSDNVVDLMAFAEEFGADRLHKACLEFLTLFQQRYEATSELKEWTSLTGEISSSDSDMSLKSGTSIDLPSEYEMISHDEAGKPYKTVYGPCQETWEPGIAKCSINVPVQKEQQENTYNTGDWSSMEVRKSWGPPKNLNNDHLQPAHSKRKTVTLACKTQFIDQRQLETSSPVESVSNNQQNPKATNPSSGQCHISSKIELESKLKNESLLSQLWEMAQKGEARRPERVREHIRSKSLGLFTCHETRAKNSETLDTTCKSNEIGGNASKISSGNPKLHLEDQPGLSEYNIEESVHDTNSRSLCQMPSSLETAASLHHETQTGPPGLKEPQTFILHRASSLPSQERSIHDKVRNKESEYGNSNAKDHMSSDLPTHNESQADCVEPIRRLRVQDAISLFEGKRKDSSDLPVKRSKNQGGKGISGNSSLPKNSVLKRWSGANELTSELSSQQNRDAGSDNEVITSQSQQVECKTSREENTSALIDGKRGGFSHMSENDHLLISHGSLNKTFSDASSSSKKVSLQLQQNLIPDSQPSSKAYDRQAINESSRVVDVDWQKQFNLELAKCFTTEVTDNNLGTVVPSEFENDKSEVNNNTLKGKVMRMTEAGKMDLRQQSINAEESGPVQGQNTLSRDTSKPSCKIMQHNLVVMVSGSALSQLSDIGSQSKSWSTLCNEMSNAATVQDTLSVTQMVTNKHTCRRGQARREVDPKVHSVGKVHSSSCKRECSDKTTVGVAGHAIITSKIGHKGCKESSCSSLDNLSLEFNMQALANIVDDQNNKQACFQSDGLRKTKRGKLYEHYSKLRDSKLREANVSQKVEREAKPKAMEETLDIRKAEMKSRTARSSSNRNLLAQTQILVKSETPKTSFLAKPIKQELEEEEIDSEEFSVLVQDQNNAYHNLISPSSTPHAGMGVLASKPHFVRKGALLKSATTCSSSYVPNSISPRSVPKKLVGKPLGPRKSAASINQANIADNLLTRSALSLTDLRKENTKASVQIPGPRVHSKSRIRAGHQRADNEILSLNITGNAATPFTKEDKKQNSMTTTRKSCATIAEAKILSEGGQEHEILASFKVQNEGIEKLALRNKVRHSIIVPIQEAKPFLRKGQGIGPGAGPGIVKLKASTTDDAKNSDEEALSSLTLNAEVGRRKDATEGPVSSNSGVGSEIDT